MKVTDFITGMILVLLCKYSIQNYAKIFSRPTYLTEWEKILNSTSTKSNEHFL